MNDSGNEVVLIVTERFERRLAEELGKLRAEMIDRNAELLKWGLVFGATQTAALAAIIALLR